MPFPDTMTLSGHYNLAQNKWLSRRGKQGVFLDADGWQQQGVPSVNALLSCHSYAANKPVVLPPRSGFVDEKAVKEIFRGQVGPEPAFIEQETVHFIRKNEYFMVHTVGPQTLDQVNGLSEHHVAVVITMNQQDRRTPIGQIVHRR